MRPDLLRRVVAIPSNRGDLNLWDPAPGRCGWAAPGAGVRDGRRPPAGRGLDASEDGAIMDARGGGVLMLRPPAVGRVGARRQPGTASRARSAAGRGCTPRSTRAPVGGPGPWW